MKKLILALCLLLLPTSLYAWGVVGMGGGTPAAAGGPDAYYYGAGSDTYAQTHELEETRAVGDDITIVATGSITKMGFKVSDKSSGNIKVMLLTTVGAKHDCQIVLNAAMTNGQWSDVTLATPLAVTANDVVSVLIGVSASYSSVVYCNTGQNGVVDSTHDYSVFCDSAPTPGSYASQAIAVRVYVD
jgi:hypothetical protein